MTNASCVTSCELFGAGSLVDWSNACIVYSQCQTADGSASTKSAIELSSQSESGSALRFMAARGLFPGGGVKISLAESPIPQIPLAEALELVQRSAIISPSQKLIGGRSSEGQ
jgi:hypothetical protein